jgi:hypothetical protein
MGDIAMNTSFVASACYLKVNTPEKIIWADYTFTTILCSKGGILVIIIIHICYFEKGMILT